MSKRTSSLSPSRHLSLFSRLTSSVSFLVGSLLAVAVALGSPIYLYPGTVASAAAAKTLMTIYEQGILPIEKSIAQVTHSLAERSEDLFNQAPLSLNALMTMPKVSLPKISLSSPVMASSAEPEVSQVSTQLIAETIATSIEPMISTPNNVLFPSALSLDAALPEPSAADTELVKEEEPKAAPVAVAAPKPVVKTASVPKPAQPVNLEQPAVISGSSRWPVVGVLSQTFSSYHPAIDIAAKYGTSVYPIQGGLVVGVINLNYGLGKHITIQHEGGLTSVYAHLSAMNVVVGQQASTGTAIGAVGTTGRSTGPHLHLATSQNGKPFNPLGRLLN